MEKYLELNAKARRELGFSTIRKNREKINLTSLANINELMDRYESSLKGHKRIVNKYKPKRINKNVEEIIRYCIRIQNRN